MKRHAVLVVAVLASLVGVLSESPIPQDATYHLMADRRSLFGIPNGLNVLSNLPFAIVGGVGLAATFSRNAGAIAFRDRWLRWPYAAVFAGAALTAFGSAYYHLAPDNARPLLIIVLVLLLYPARERGTRHLVAGLVAYAVAKGFEMADAQVLALGQIVSGHTLKHLAAAAGVGCLVAMIRARARSASEINPEPIGGYCQVEVNSVD